MRLGRTSRVLFLTLGGAVGCNAYPTLKNVPIDCTADSAYDIQYVYTFDTTASTMFYGSGDHPSDADVSQMPAVQSLTDGARCGSTTALLLHTPITTTIGDRCSGFTASDPGTNPLTTGCRSGRARPATPPRPLRSCSTTRTRRTWRCPRTAAPMPARPRARRTPARPFARTTACPTGEPAGRRPTSIRSPAWSSGAPPAPRRRPTRAETNT